MEIGRVVEFIDKQRIMCALVLEVKKERLRVLTEHNREIKLSPARLAHHSTVRIDGSGSRLRQIEALKSVAERRRTLAAGIDVKSLWEVLSEETEWIDLPTMAGLCFPEGVDPDQTAAVARALFDHRLYFRFEQSRFLPIPPDLVAQRLAQEAEAARFQRVVEAGSDWLTRLAKAASTMAPPPVETPADLETMFVDYVLYGKESPHAPLVREMLFRSA